MHQTVGAEFDGQPLGSLNAELYTILFSLRNTGTHGRWRGRDESSESECVCSHFTDVKAWRKKTKWQRDNEPNVRSALSPQRPAVLTVALTIIAGVCLLLHFLASL